MPTACQHLSSDHGNSRLLDHIAVELDCAGTCGNENKCQGRLAALLCTRRDFWLLDGYCKQVIELLLSLLFCLFLVLNQQHEVSIKPDRQQELLAYIVPGLVIMHTECCHEAMHMLPSSPHSSLAD